jgi:hypothetical protein
VDLSDKEGACGSFPEDDWNWPPDGVNLVAVNAVIHRLAAAMDAFNREPFGQRANIDDLIGVLGFLERFLTVKEASFGYTPAQCVEHRLKLLPVIRMMLRLPPEEA